MYPSLKQIEPWLIEGDFEIHNPRTQEVLETFRIKILFPPEYPNSKLPLVQEIGNKVPRIKDRHVYPDGTFCLTTPLNEFVICRKGITFLRFLNEILRPFLATQIAISEGWLNEFPQGEYSHGEKGILESYIDFLDLSNIRLLISGLEMSLTKIERNCRCFCQSGLKLKRCHLQQINILRNMGKKRVTSDLNALKTLASKNRISTSQNI